MTDPTPTPSSGSSSTERPKRSGLAACAISEHFDTRTAGTEIAHELHESMDGATPDLVVMFASFHHAAAFEDVADTVTSTLGPRVLLGCTAESVLGGEVELEGRAGLAAIAISTPAAATMELHPFALPPDAQVPASDPDAVAKIIGLSEHHRATLVLADPFSVPVPQFVQVLSACAGEQRRLPIIGGIASGAGQPGHNVLIMNDQIQRGGVVGASIGGEHVEADFIVSQGCRPIGKPMVITKAKDNVILELGGKRAFDVLQSLAQTLDPKDRALLGKGLFVGVVIDENKQHHGRGDFLIRNVIGVDEDAGGIAMGDVAQLGRTVQLHVRDAETATEDLQLLLDMQQLRDPALAGLLFTCNGRGSRLFDEPNHDLGTINQRLAGVPIAGFFAGGEIAPVGGRSFLHGHTAALLLLRHLATPSN